MAIVDYGPCWLGMPSSYAAAAPALATPLTIDTSTEKVAFCFQAPKTGTLDLAEFRATIVNNPDNGIRISFQTIDPATGFPDGTQDQFRDITGALSTGWFVPGKMTDDGTNGGVQRSVTAGEYVAIVIEFITFVAADSFQVQTLSQPSPSSGVLGNFPYVASFSGSWAMASTFNPVFALKYTDGSYGFIGGGVYPISVINTVGFNSGSTPDENALRFVPQITSRVTGVWLRVDADGDFDVVLYDSGSSALATVSVDKEMRAGTGGATGYIPLPPTTVTAGATYRLSIKPTSVTSLTVYTFDVNANALLAAVEGGIAFDHSTRTDAGAWTDVTTRRMFAGLMINGIDTGGGGGGSASAYASA